MPRKAVTMIQDSGIIKTLADPSRREILRQVTLQPQTETRLAQTLRLTKPTVGYHLQALLKAKLIRIGRTEIGTHGILEKYYEPTSSLFIEDFERVTSESIFDLSTSTYAYFLQLNMERLLGMLSALQLIEETQEQTIKIGSKELKELAEEIARRVAHIGRRYEETETDLDRHMLLIKIYSKALESVITEEKWKKLFQRTLLTLQHK